MTVYFDKENYINYLKTVHDSTDGIDTLRMLKKQLNIHLNFNISDLDEYESIFLEEFQSGISPEFTITHSSNPIKRPLVKDSFPSSNGVYLLQDSAEVKKIQDLHTVLISNISEEIEVLKKLIINEDYSFHLERIIGENITPAQHLNILDLPFSSLVVVDRYIFKGPELGGNLGMYDFNLDKILRRAYNNKKGYGKIIFVYQVNTRVGQTEKSYDAGPDLQKMSEKVKKIIGKHCPAPELYFIGVPSGLIDDEHDRYIFTNYLRIKSGDSLVYFDSNGDIKTKSKTVDHYSLAFRSYRETNKILLDKISNIVKTVLDTNNRHCKVPSGTVSNSVLSLN